MVPLQLASHNSPSRAPNKKQRHTYNQNDSQSNKADANDAGLGDGENQNDIPRSVSISVFQVFATGFHCSVCQIQVGCGIDAVGRHLKKFHCNIVVQNLSLLHASMISARDGLVKSISIEIPSVAKTSSESETRLKCLVCECSYTRLFNFFRHISRSNGRCAGSIPTKMLYMKAECGRFVETESSNSSCSVSNKNMDVHPSFDTITSTMSKYIRDDEDVDTFVSIFAPLLQSNTNFESIVHQNVDL